MKKGNRPVIDNPQFRDSSSKLIFGDNVLCSQFLRDYADMEILRNICPEDIEDVSERYVPLYSTERESDTVKKVNISKYLSAEKNENLLQLPLYIVSLIEHKTKVEYNISMQILRYMVHIWEDYEKEMNTERTRISSRKDFRYPPILPIVYYEGKERWTASIDLADRILCGELLHKYLPHFKYQMVRLHDYSNEQLLEKGDEISLAMMINKIQSAEDISVFEGIPKRRVDRILKDTPDYLLDTMAKVMRTLLYSMDIPEKETENAVAMIKERKMGQLFEQVPRNLRAERKKWKKEAEAERDEAYAQRDEAFVERDEAFVERDEAYEERNEAYAQRNEAYAQRDAANAELAMRRKENEILKYLNRMLRERLSDEKIESLLMVRFSLTREQAESYMRITGTDD